LEQNEIFSLLGENGAGKTTLISILSGLLHFDDGTIHVQPSLEFFQSGSTSNKNPVTLNLTEERDICRNLISVCPQYDFLWEDLSVQENMSLVGLFKGIANENLDKEINNVLTKINLLKEKNNLVRNLSGGMKRRISIGLALLGNSQLIILDEPTTGLDPVNRKAIWEFIRQLKAQNKTVLLTTHIMDEADVLSDRVGVISKGNLLSVSSTVDLKTRFSLLNLIISVKKFSEKGYSELWVLLDSVFGAGSCVLKYRSNKTIKINLPAGDDDLVFRLVSELDKEKFEEEGSLKMEGGLHGFIENYELASLDLEEAYMMLSKEDQDENDAY
jgi:ATP-binding cassette subfamily A (ABC1) protein 3